MGEVAQSKRLLRTRMWAVRAAIAADSDGRAARSGVICERVVAEIDRRRADPRRVMVYEPMATEPDLGPLVAWCRSRRIDVFVPLVDGERLAVEPGDLDPRLLDVVVV